VQILAQLKKKMGGYSNFLLFIFKQVKRPTVAHHSGSAVFLFGHQCHLLGAHRAKWLAQVLGESTLQSAIAAGALHFSDPPLFG
jgi:hypothetical protein